MGLAAGLAGGGIWANELRQLRPSDEAGEDKALASLLDQMRLMTKNRDHRALEALMLPDFRVEFDVGKGAKAFHSHWRPDLPDSGLWEILRRLLMLGGTFYSRTLFAIPYVYTHFPADLDPFGHVVALGEEVILFDEPKLDAKRVGSLEYSIAPLARPVQPPVVIPADSFPEINHPGASRCFVAASEVYSPAGHRVFFEKRRGRWRWISLAAATLAEPPDLELLRRKGVSL